jgi:hypothetical protein
MTGCLIGMPILRDIASSMLKKWPSLLVVLLYGFTSITNLNAQDTLREDFAHPPADARPGVYWYFLDGNMSRDGITKDLESMNRAGIGKVLFLEVNIGMPMGPVGFLSDEWDSLFLHAEKECERLGIEMSLAIGPGWAGSGGPWIKPEQSMQLLVFSKTQVTGPAHVKIRLPVPAVKPPYLGTELFSASLKKQWEDFYEDVVVMAVPTTAGEDSISDFEHKALYYRPPFSASDTVRSWFPSYSGAGVSNPSQVIGKNKIINITSGMQANSELTWDVPPGKWTIMRFGRRSNGAITRPAPEKGLGFEADKCDTIVQQEHLNAYIGKLIQMIGKPDPARKGGLKKLHMDSWEMGSQNWTPQLVNEFKKRRGYDPVPFFPVYTGAIVESPDISERFLWDLRTTFQELMLENNAAYVKRYAHQNGLLLSIEPYDMNPTGDLALGVLADLPMCEFWTKNCCYKTTYSVPEATSAAHLIGQPVVQSESFTALESEGRKQHPASVKEQGDWAFAAGINCFYYHTFQHQHLNDSLLPGMTFGSIGVHWDRGQTWWAMANGYHEYISRCQFLLQKGRPVADILYLSPEGAPSVFLPPSTAMTTDTWMPDRKGYNFDGCPPGLLYNAFVKDHRILFPGGASYSLLVMPASQSMTPALLNKIGQLIRDGAVVVGSAPYRSPGLSGYPRCDKQVIDLAQLLWGKDKTENIGAMRRIGKGKLVTGPSFHSSKPDEMYPSYAFTEKILRELDLQEDFISNAPIRYTHRSDSAWDIYFISNRSSSSVKGDCIFRSVLGPPEIWDPISGDTRKLPIYKVNRRTTSIPIELAGLQSFFIVFSKTTKIETETYSTNFPQTTVVDSLNRSWDLDFDKKWGGPGKVHLDSLIDWATSDQEGIKYYSGTVLYRKVFDFENKERSDRHVKIYLDLGQVKNIARIKMNGIDLGVCWVSPFRKNISNLLRAKDNVLEVEVANLWTNRLIGDDRYPDDGIKDGKWPEWLLKGEPRKSKRYTFTTFKYYTKDSALVQSGLIGPVTILQERSYLSVLK